jgi:hypothetical protein
MTRAQVNTIAAIGLFLLLVLGGFTWLVLGQRGALAAVPATPLPSGEVAATLTVFSEDTPTAAVAATVENAAATLAVYPPPSATLDPLGCLPTGEGALGRVSEVLPDGVLRVEMGKQVVEVKLLGADPAGSSGQAAGLLRELAEGKEVRLLRDTEDSDSAGRLLRYVVAEGNFLNYILVRQGAALPALFPPGQACSETMLAAEQLARSEGLGYWSQQAGQGASVQAAATATALPCDCSKAYQCTDFSTHNAAQTCYDACGDYRNVTLDADNNGLACEQLP